MANHQSAIKRIRSNGAKNLRNRYQAKTTRNSLRDFREIKTKAEAEKMAPEVISMLDKLAKKNVIHKNKASNLKSEVMKHINNLQK
jgi:small subunit ribosomal protein S20